jgi:hypothetical protein
MQSLPAAPSLPAARLVPAAPLVPTVQPASGIALVARGSAVQ